MPITSPSNCSKLIRIRANAGALYNRKRASNNDHCTIYLAEMDMPHFKRKHHQITHATSSPNPHARTANGYERTHSLSTESFAQYRKETAKNTSEPTKSTAMCYALSSSSTTREKLIFAKDNDKRTSSSRGHIMETNWQNSGCNALIK